MLQVIVTRGLRGTEVYRAQDRDSAEKTVRQILASAIREDKRTTFARLDKDRADAWRIMSGKYHGDIIQITAVTGENKSTAYYNLAATVSVLSRGTEKEKERDLNLKTVRLAMDTTANMKRAAKDQNRNGRIDYPCHACRGTGKEKQSAELGFVLLPAQGRPRPVEYRKFEIVSVACPRCNGTGERE